MFCIVHNDHQYKRQRTKGIWKQTKQERVTQVSKCSVPKWKRRVQITYLRRPVLCAVPHVLIWIAIFIATRYDYITATVLGITVTAAGGILLMELFKIETPIGLGLSVLFASWLYYFIRASALTWPAISLTMLPSVIILITIIMVILQLLHHNNTLGGLLCAFGAIAVIAIWANGSPAKYIIALAMTLSFYCAYNAVETNMDTSQD